MFRIISIKAKSGIPFLCFCFYITGKFIIYIQFIPEFIGFMIDERLESAIKQTGARVLILDPIQAYLGGTMDMNRANEARDMTKRLSLLAEKYKCAILLIGHMNKAGGNKAAYRGMGSIDFFSVARSVLLVGRIEGEPDLRAVVQIKNNLAAFGHSKAFHLTETGFEWIGDYEITADEVLGGIAPKVNKLEQAKRC